MQYRAVHRHADTGPRKIRLFADLIRGRNADEALQLLRFYHNRGAKLLEAVVRSALGNADDQECPDLDSLIVSEARVDGGPTFKRIQPRARGTAFQIKRRMAHIHITLSDPPEEETPEPTAPQVAATTVTQTTATGPAPLPDITVPQPGGGAKAEEPAAK